MKSDRNKDDKEANTTDGGILSIFGQEQKNI